ncbi:DUF6933 domain-containing protein [Celerinatantimonas diazotrophica]|uniref:Uncharacterized protein n=1 Tax=Celerinatantimonas diazotrophica TaxID=412034 RepID=A0A4R1J9Q1_9GAMM|nr:hypothetical protein [Celerinatantimonas diazotrophica]TCK47318.1 hypothetical protein EV690_2335 [Celerinatantimonas diazotrophica]CAG9295066.1 hypothetical protein CEDIAZO_00172 [Celerinatantimonas diazotrophica]
MIQLQLSTTVHPALTHSDVDSYDSFRWEWSGHQFTIAQQECLLLMEQQSGYVMLFFDLTGPDYATFLRVWQRRLLAEVLTVSDLDPLSQSRLQFELLERCDQLHIGRRKTLISETMQTAVTGVQLLARHHQCLPENESDEFRWGVILNQARSFQGRTAYQHFTDNCQLWVDHIYATDESTQAIVWH